MYLYNGSTEQVKGRLIRFIPWRSTPPQDVRALVRHDAMLVDLHGGEFLRLVVPADALSLDPAFTKFHSYVVEVRNHYRVMHVMRAAPRVVVRMRHTIPAMFDPSCDGWLERDYGDC